MLSQKLLAEHGDLTHVSGATLAAGGADYSQHIQRLQGAAGDKHSLHVRAQVGRINQKTLSAGQAEVVRHEAFENFSVSKLDSHPQAFGARAGGERFARERIGVAELAHEEDALDVGKVDA